MIKVTKCSKPSDFDTKVKVPGNNWLFIDIEVRKKDPRDLWSKYRDTLAKGFKNRCGYSAMLLLDGHVDHYLSCNNYPHRIYEWWNYRYISGSINSSKGTHDTKVLDPYEVEDDWFEILLPSLQLVLTDKIPSYKRERASFTIDKLKLDTGENVVRFREAMCDEYLNNNLPINNLDFFAPLLARAYKKAYNEYLAGTITFADLEVKNPRLSAAIQNHQNLDEII
jgi:hypothetical protein